MDRHYNHFPNHHPPTTTTTTKLFKACKSLLLSTLPVPYHSLISPPHSLNLLNPIHQPTLSPPHFLPYPLAYLVPVSSLSCPYLAPVLSLSRPCLVLYLLPLPPETWSSTLKPWVLFFLNLRDSFKHSQYNKNKFTLRDAQIAVERLPLIWY